MKAIAVLILMLLVASLAGWATAGEQRPQSASPATDMRFASVAKAASDATMTSRGPRLTSFSAPSASTLGGNRLAATQYTSGGWGWPLTAPPTYGNIHGPIGMGLAHAYQQTGIAGQKTGLTKAGTFLLAKTNNFSPSDGYIAAMLDKVLGVATYKAHVKTNFYDPLAAGTYNRNGAGTLYTTSSYVSLIRTSRAGAQANIAAWDIGMGLVGAAMCGAGTADWIAGVKAEIDELVVGDYYDVIGLAGAVYGLAYVLEPFDPTAGSHAAAASVDDLATILAGYQISGGGFTWNGTMVSLGNETTQETAYAILALNEVDRPTYLLPVQGAASYLMSVQLGTGGWDNYPGDPDGENNEITGEALWGIGVSYPAPVHNLTKDVYYPTIQGAVTDAAAGNTIHVASGLYHEQVTINKALTINGDDGAALDGTGLAPTWTTGVKIKSGDVTFNNIDVQNFTQDGIICGYEASVPGSLKNIHITNCRVANIVPGYWGFGIYVGYEGEGWDYVPPKLTAHLDYAGLLIENNEITNTGNSGVVLQSITASTGALQVRNNHIHGIATNDAIWIDGARTILIENNVIENNKWGIDFTCIGEAWYTLDGPRSAKDVTVLGNTIRNNAEDGMAVYNGWPGTIAVHGNSISGNTPGVVNYLASTLSATGNYWGTLHGPTDAAGTLEVPRAPKPSVADMRNAVPPTKLGDAVSDNVDYFPWDGPGSAGVHGGGIWAGAYVNPVSNDILAGFDVAALDGVDALDTVAPPPPPADYIYLYFRTDPGQPIENYGVDIKKDEASLATVAKAWDLKAITDHSSSLVTIEFPGTGLPPGFKPTIYDLAANTHQNLRENPAFTYTSPASETVVSFRLLMGDSAKPSVAVTAPNGGEFLVVGTPFNIAWTSSDGTGVLEHEIYYSLTGAAPYTLLTTVDGTVHTYSWTPALASLTASVKVVARDSVMNEEFDVSDHTFAILASNSVSFDAEAGWNLVSPPMLQGVMTPAAVFGDDYGATPYYVFQFSASSGYSMPAALNMGQGYWLGSNSAQTVDAVGTPQSSASLALGDGFNIIGNPFAAGLLKADLRFYDGSLTKNMADAAAAGWLSNVLYGYSGGSYFTEGTSLGVWQGYWIPMMQPGITVQYAPSVVVPTPKEPVPMTPTNWDVTIAATLTADPAESFTDRIASFGVRVDATSAFNPLYDAPRPPRSPMKGYVEVSFPPKDGAAMAMFGSSFARSFRAADRAAWEFSVHASTDGVVTLSWDNAAIGTLPDDVRIELVDKANHTTIDMKRSGSYTYAHSGSSHAFAVNKAGTSDLPAVPAEFSLAQNYPNPFNPSSVIQYGLPADAVVFLEVYNSLGQRVATLLDGRDETAGFHQVTFSATELSSGIYIYRLSATASDGTQFTLARKMLFAK